MKGLNFVKKIFELTLVGIDIFFTDECILDLSPFYEEFAKCPEASGKKCKIPTIKNSQFLPM